MPAIHPVQSAGVVSRPCLAVIVSPDQQPEHRVRAKLARSVVIVITKSKGGACMQHHDKILACL